MSSSELRSLAAVPPEGPSDVVCAEVRYSYHPLSLLRSALAGGAFLGFGLGGWLLSVLVLPLVYLWPGSRFARRRRCQRTVAWSFRFFHAYMRVAGLIDYRPERRVPAHTAPSVWIANHPSLVDVSAVIAAHPELCCVVKASVYRNPLFFPLMLACGHIPVDRDDPASGARVLELAAGRLREGHHVLVFPEGTRSPALGVGAFHPGAFAMATAAGAPIQPVLLVADSPFLKRGTPWYKVPRSLARLRIEALPPIDTAALGVSSRAVSSRTLCRRTQQLFEERLREEHARLAAPRTPHERAGT